MSSFLSCSVSLATSCRVTSTSATEQRHTAHGSRLSRTSLSSSARLDCSKSVVELRCSNSIVELHGTLDDSLPARNSRAHANCSETQLRAHVFAGKHDHTDSTQLFGRPRTIQVNAPTSAPKHRHILPGRPAGVLPRHRPDRPQQQHTRAHQKAN